MKGWVLGTLRIKKTCHGCKADDNRGCLLGYKNENKTIKGFEGLSAGRIPLEVCPKPKTNDEYIKLKMQ